MSITPITITLTTVHALDFDMLYRLHAKELTRKVRRLTRSDPSIDPQDIVQDTFVEAILTQDECPANAFGWLYTIACNLAMQALHANGGSLLSVIPMQQAERVA